jgi:hypothetical protein
MPTYRFDSRAAKDWLEQAERFERFARRARDPILRANFQRMAADVRDAAAQLGATASLEPDQLPAVSNDL